MPRGGARAGAGRKKGSTKEVIAGRQLKTQATLPDGDVLREELEKLGDDFDAKKLMQALYKSKTAPLDVRFTAAAKVLPFEAAKPRANLQAATGVSITLKRYVPT